MKEQDKAPGQLRDYLEWQRESCSLLCHSDSDSTCPPPERGGLGKTGPHQPCPNRERGATWGRAPFPRGQMLRNMLRCRAAGPWTRLMGAAGDGNTLHWDTLVLRESPIPGCLCGPSGFFSLSLAQDLSPLRPYPAIGASQGGWGERTYLSARFHPFSPLRPACSLSAFISGFPVSSSRELQIRRRCRDPETRPPHRGMGEGLISPSLLPPVIFLFR